MPDPTNEAPSEKTQTLIPVQVIRAETVLSKLPIHNLSKTGAFEIQITRRKSNGELELFWSVSHSAKYGPPRQLAYKLDTLVVNRRIDELGRPIPKLVRLGSLRDIARELDLGGDTNSIRKALRQNAFTGITAKLTYRTVEGGERRIEADFTRYGVVFAGEKLPNGEEADGVYLVLNEPYLEVLNHAPRRPLNYDYLKELTPAAQRFYEIVSYRVYAALKRNRPTARLPYSDFCTFSALQRYSDYDHFKKQMYKIHRPHLESGYLAKAYYEETMDGAGGQDWIMRYVPGPRARAEFELFDRGFSSQGREVEDETETDAAEAETEAVLGEMIKRGVSEQQARRLLGGRASAEESRRVLEQLRWGDYLIAQSRGRIRNPPGFYSYLVANHVAPPQGFVACASPGQPAAEPAIDPQLEAAYEEYKRGATERYLKERYSEAEFQRLVAEKARELRSQYRSSAFWTNDDLLEVAEGTVRAEAAGAASILTFEQWRARSRG